MLINDLPVAIEKYTSADYDSFSLKDTDIILLDRSDDGDMFQIYKNELDDLMRCFSNLDEYGNVDAPYRAVYDELCTIWRLRGLPRNVGICGAVVIRGNTEIALDWHLEV